MYDSMESGTEEFGPTSEGDGALLVGEVRAIYARAGGPIGHVPPVEGKAKPSTATVALIDKLGERLAFERSGARFYEALISKHDAYGSFDGGPSRGDLEDIRREEHEHFLMLHQVIVQMGGDPAAVTPSADLVTVVSRGVQDAVTDPRTNLLQGLEAILVAELSDTASWEMLIEIAAQAGQTQLQAAFQRAHESEEEHVEKVTAWIQAGYGLD
jgi:rubrerythrin